MVPCTELTAMSSNYGNLWSIHKSSREFLKQNPPRADRKSVAGRVVLERQVVHIPDSEGRSRIRLRVPNSLNRTVSAWSALAQRGSSHWGYHYFSGRKSIPLRTSKSSW